MATYYWLKLFAEDGVTLLADYSTDPAHARPYMQEPSNLVGQDIDIVKGTAKISGCSIAIGDVPTIAGDDDSGHVTAILPQITKGTPYQLLQNEDGAGWVNVIRGSVDGVRLHESLSAYELSLKDEHENVRRVRAFTRCTTSTVVPRGVLDGFGYNPVSGTWLIPPTKDRPLQAVVGTTSEPIFARGQLTFPALPGYGTIQRVTTEVDRIITPKMRQQFDLNNQTYLGTIASNIRILWRLPGDVAYNVIEEVGGLLITEVLRTSQGTYKGITVDVLDALQFDWPGRPADGTAVDVIVGYAGPASDDYPFHFEGPFGTLVANCLDGMYSEEGVPLVAYGAAAVAALTEMCRLRLKKPFDDEDGIWKFLQDQCYAPLSAAGAFDENGAISPIRSELPDAGAVLLEIDDTNAELVPGWEKSTNSAINVVSIDYPRLYRVEAADDPTSDQSGGDGLAERRVKFIEAYAPSLATAIGTKPLEMKVDTLAAIGGPEGQALTGDVIDEYGAQICRRKAHQTFDRRAFGAQQFGPIRISAAAWAGHRVGDFVLANCSWWPDFGTARRGANRLAQVMTAVPRSDGSVEVMAEDCGDDAAPVAAPAAGALALTGDNLDATTFLLTPAVGTTARAEYAISDIAPSNDSPLWRAFMPPVDVATQVTTPPVPLGATIWRRQRGEMTGRRPSAWSVPAGIATAPAARITTGRMVVADDGTATVIWEANALTLGVRIEWGTAPAGVAPVLTGSDDVDATIGSYVLPDPVPAGFNLLVSITPYMGFAGGAVSGTAGTPLVLESAWPGGAVSPAEIVTATVQPRFVGTTQVGWTLYQSVNDSTNAVAIAVAGEVALSAGQPAVVDTSVDKTITIDLDQDPGSEGTVTVVPYRDTAATVGPGKPYLQVVSRPPVTTVSAKRISRTEFVITMSVEPASAVIHYRIFEDGSTPGAFGVYAGPFILAPTSADDSILQYYSTVAGIINPVIAEEVKSSRYDADDKPEVVIATLTEDPDGVLVLQVEVDDDCAEWEVYARLGTSTLDANGVPEPAWLKYRLPAYRSDFSLAAADGTWYVAVRGLDFNSLEGAADEKTFVVGGAPSVEVLTGIEVNQVFAGGSNRKNRLSWLTNATIEGSGNYRVAVWGAVDSEPWEELTPVAGGVPTRQARTDFDGTNTDPATGSFDAHTWTACVKTVPPSTACGYRTFYYRIELWLNTGMEPIAQYFISTSAFTLPLS